MTESQQRLSIRSVDAATIAVAGEIDAHTTTSLLETLIDAIAKGDVQLDMSEITFMDSSGLRTLVEALRRSTESGTKFSIMRPSQSVVRLLDMTGLTDQLDIRS